MASIDAGWPYRCTGSTTRVRGVIRDATESGSSVKSRGSMSANRAVAPTARMALSVATNVNGLVTTSSPAPTPRASKAAEQRGRAGAHRDRVADAAPLAHARFESLRPSGPARAAPSATRAGRRSSSSAPMSTTPSGIGSDASGSVASEARSEVTRRAHHGTRRTPGRPAVAPADSRPRRTRTPNPRGVRDCRRRARGRPPDA